MELPSLSLPSPFLPPLRSMPLRSSQEVWGSAVLGGVQAEIEFGAFYLYDLTSGGNNVNDFPESQLTKNTVWTIN